MARDLARRGGTFLIGAALLLTGLRASSATAEPASSPLVAIDVGHTLSAPGATSARGRSEYEFNRLLVDAVLRQARAVGLRTALINGNGRIEGLTDRTALADREGASFFISIHHDSVQPQFLRPWSVDGAKRLRSEGRHGYSLFVSRRNPDPVGSLRCASAIGRKLRESGFTPSTYHGETIVGENRPFADEKNGVYFYDGLAVLRTSRSPAALLEAGVISDADEELVLARAATREAIGRAVVVGLRNCLIEELHEPDSVDTDKEKQ